MPPDAKLLMSRRLWSGLAGELHARTHGVHESGAFLLGAVTDQGRRVEKVVFYDDLDPRAYETGVVILHAASFGPLWDACTASGLLVVADVHVHEFEGFQSRADRAHPMIAQRGHLALILPDFAAPPIDAARVGFYEYLGSHRWRTLSGASLGRHLLIED